VTERDCRQVYDTEKKRSVKGQVKATCARWSWILSFRVHVKLSYRIVSYRI